MLTKLSFDKKNEHDEMFKNKKTYDYVPCCIYDKPYQRSSRKISLFYSKNFKQNTCI